MSDARTRTLATLDAFLDSQRHLLARTQSDLHKLAGLRERALADPEDFVDNAENELDNPAFKLSQYEPPQRPEEIDWELFTSFDPSPFTNIAIPGPPPVSSATKQISPPSELQTFVREANKSILGDFQPFVAREPEDDPLDVDADAANEQRLAELVEQGKANLPQASAKIDAGTPSLRKRASSNKLSCTREALGLDTKGKGKVDKSDNMSMNIMPLQNYPQARGRPQRLRKPKIRPDEIYAASPPVQPSPPSPSSSSPPNLPLLRKATFGSDKPESAKRAPSEDSLSDETVTEGPRRKKTKRQENSKQRKPNAPSETFNLPWSLSEQHLLEKLLEEIPAGEKQRWAKISKAMSGKRTPRQVASRVQKYFEKLKKFGVEPG
ncbi:hypothetical protein K439DRAFT_880160 [Ramaria rubella]|nr:hypothetical protein K439DRAFT_880160 [Ramaria rubella]